MSPLYHKVSISATIILTIPKCMIHEGHGYSCFHSQTDPAEKREFRTALNLEFERNLADEDPTNCPHCKSEDITNRGSCRGVKRYKCRECLKTFTARTETAFHYTKKSLETWNRYLDLMFGGHMPLRRIAKEVNITLVTAFNWRHKILHALKQMEGPQLNGIVEADETYFALSYKGKKKGMPRKSRRRGGEVRKRGISKEQVCVLTAIDRTRNTLLQSTCLARPTIKQVTDTLGPRIAKDAFLVTDKHSAYPGFARKQGLTHHALEHRTSSTSNAIHLQTVNSLHSQVKRFMRPFNGVATKYLDNYMAFYRWTKQDPVAARAQPTASITGAKLAAMEMTLK